MLDRLLLLLVWVVGAFLAYIAFVKIPSKFFNYVLHVLMGLTMFVFPISMVGNWIIAGNLDWTFTYTVWLVVLDIALLLMLFISLLIRGEKDKDVNLNLF